MGGDRDPGAVRDRFVLPRQTKPISTGPPSHPMVQRVAGRRGWLPAQLAWVPVLLLGMWLLVLRVEATPRGDGVWWVQVVILSPPAWFDPVGRGAAGASVLALGAVLAGLAAWRPHPGRVPLVITRFPGFAMAGSLLLIVAGLSLWKLSGHVIDAAAGGLDWRFIATSRRHPLDRVVAWTAAGSAVVCYVLSFAGPWHRALRPRRVPAEPQAQ